MSDNVTETTANVQPSAPAENVNTQPQVEQTQVQEQTQTQEPVVENNNSENKEVNEVDDFTSAYNVNEQTENKQEQEEHTEPVVPEKYNLTTSDGSELPAENAEHFNKFFRENKFTQEQAQAAFSAFENELKDMKAYQTDGFNKLKGEWLSQIKADRELGGQNLSTTKMNIGRVMEKFGTPELKDYLNKSGLGLHPSFVRLMSKVGAALGNDTHFIDGKGGAPTDAEKQRLSIKALYPNSPELWGGR